MNQLHAERQCHAQDLLRLAFGLDDHGGDDGLAGLDAAILAGKANLLGVGVLALQAELRPGRIDQLNLLVRGLGTRSGSACRRRRRLLRGRCRCRRSGLRRRLRARALGLWSGRGAPGAGAGVWA